MTNGVIIALFVFLFILFATSYNACITVSFMMGEIRELKEIIYKLENKLNNNQEQ